MKSSDFGIYILYIFLAAVILAGLYFLVNYGTKSFYKIAVPTQINNTAVSVQKNDIIPPSPDDVPGCPNVLIRRGNLLLLIDTHSPPQTGKNPVIFKSLDEYKYYVKLQRDAGNKSCPILFLQEESNAQGEDVYRVRSGPFDQTASPSASMKMSEVGGIQQFFKNQPSQTASPSAAFKDVTAPSSFNKDAKVINTDAKTTGFGPGPKNSNDGKLTRVENISTETFQTGPQPVFAASVLSSPTGVPSLPPSTVTTSPGAMAPIPTPLSTASSIAPPTLTYSLPTAAPVTMIQGSITGPISNATMYPPNTTQPVNTQLFNGTLGRYSGQMSVPFPPVPVSVTPYVDSSRDDKPYNQNQYPGFDPYGQFIGKYTNIDQVHDSTKMQAPFSDNPMDPNWGGVLYTRNQVVSGKYDDNKVEKPIYGGSVNVSAIPSLMPNGGIPIYVEKGTPPANCDNQANMKTRFMRSSPENA